VDYVSTDTNVDDELLMEIIKNLDQTIGCQAKTQRNYSVLAEKSEGYAGRIVLKGLKNQLPLDDLRCRKPDYQDKKNLYVDVTGDFFPDLIEENGVFLISEPFLEYLQNRIHLRKKHVYNYIGLCTANNASIHTYCLLVPPQFDCILAGSARYDKERRLTYFEINESKVGKAEIFRIKGFPHLIVTRPLSRINGTGFECARIETFFDYAGVRDRDYQERQNGQRLTAALKEYERRVMASDNYAYKHGLAALADLRSARQEAAAGLRSIFSSYRGPTFSTEELAARNLTFTVFGPEAKIVLNEAIEFSQNEFSLHFLPKALRYLETVPEVLRTAGRAVIYETVLAALSQESSHVFDNYANIHGGLRFRLYLESDLIKTTNPPLIYDYQNPTQRAIPNMLDWRSFKWQNRDLRECDFSGQTLNGLTISNANLAGARFNGCNLNNTEFHECNLTGAEFKQAKLQGAKFDNCKLRRTNFDYAEMSKAKLKGLELFQCSFMKTDLNGALFHQRQLFNTYFYRAKLFGAVFEVPRSYNNLVFRLCDLRRVRFVGPKTNGSLRLLNVMSGCDFRNSDLSECDLAVNKIVASSFVNTKLCESDFSKCKMLFTCDFRDSSCAGLNLKGTRVAQCNFTKVDLSRLKVKSGTVFAGNNFTHTNLSGYDFTVSGCLSPNNYTNANLSGCRLENTDFSAALANRTNFNNARLSRAIFTTEQLPFINLSAAQRDEIELQDEAANDEDDGTEENESMNGDGQDE
jgi:uncharacterized protein YjbI with pentapeptide repeats